MDFSLLRAVFLTPLLAFALATGHTGSGSQVFAGLIDWGAFWNAETSTASLVDDGISITLSASPVVPTVAVQPNLHLRKGSEADQRFVITFSSPVTFSQGFADLNTWDESVTNFSAAPSSVAINPGHAWNGTTLTFAGSTKPDSSTLTWQGITSLTFDFVHNNAAEFQFTDAQVARVSVPEPSTTAMVLAGLACGGWQLVRRARR